MRRIAAQFDFEEPDNPYPVPRHWVTAQDTERFPRPGFPRFNQAEFDFGVAAGGKASVRLSTRGGGVSLRLQPGVVPVFAGGDYAVTARVRTDGLTDARAFVVARLLDQSSQPVAGAEVWSAPVMTHGDWQGVALRIIDVAASAAFLQVELLVLQPRQFLSGPPGGAGTVWPEDLSGAAWFDDVVVSQLARVEVTTGAPANIVLQPDHPVLHVLVRDFVGEKLDGHLIVTDVDDQVVQDIQLPLGTMGRPQDWTPRLPALGWYRATLAVFGEKSGGERYRVGGTTLDFLWLGPAGRLASDESGRGQGPDGTRTDRSRFGLIADRASPIEMRDIGAVARRTGTGFVTLPVCGDGITSEGVLESLEEFGGLVDGISRAGQQIVMCIPSVPRDLLAEFPISADDPLALARIDRARWMPLLRPVLDRYGQRLTRWQIGRTGTDGAFWSPDAGRAAAAFRDELATLVPGPAVAIPWRGEFELPDRLMAPMGGGGMVVWSYPAAFGAGEVGAQIAKAAERSGVSSGGTELVFVPELPDDASYSPRVPVVEAARRIVEFWGARTGQTLVDAPVKAALDHPWRVSDGTRPQLMPAAALGALRTLIEHLSERRVVGEYPVSPGVRCLILADSPAGPGAGSTGALVAWNESAAPDAAVIHRYLGPGSIEAVDIFGNSTPVEKTDEPGTPHRVRVGETPVFIEGADPLLASFCASAAVDPAFLPAVQTEHELSLVLTNPWPAAITGRLQIMAPGGAEGRRRWTITPDGIVSFSLGAGQTKRIPWQVAFPFFEETGEKEFSLVVQLTTDHELPPIVLPMHIQVGLRDLGIDPEVRLGPSLEGPDVIVTATVSNKSNRSRMLKLEAVAPGFPTQQTVIAELPGGEAVIKRLVFKDAAPKVSGKRIWLSLSDTEDQERLTTSLLVP